MAGSATGLTATTDANGVATVGSWQLGAGGASCAVAAISSCTRNKLHAVAAGVAGAVDFKAYVPPIIESTILYQAMGNNTLVIPASNGLLTNAFSINGDGANGTGLTVTVTTPTVSTTHGDVTIAADGSFSFLSKSTVSNAQGAFTYSVTDGRAAGDGIMQLDVRRRVWYLQPGYAGTSVGSDVQPFKTFAAVAAVAAAADTTLVLTGTGTLAAGTLRASQGVYGQGASVAKTYVTPVLSGSRNASTSITVLAPGTAPKIAALTLLTNNSIRGVELTGMLSGTSFGTLRVSETSINSAVQAISLTTGTLVGSLASVTSSGGTNNILLSSVASSGFAFGTGALSGATGDAFSVTGAAATLTYAGNISKASGSGFAVNIATVTGGGITLSGNINSLAAPGKGISITGNTDGTFTFNGAEIGISSGTANGVSITGNSAAMDVVFTPLTALQITNTGGVAFNVTTGGVVSLAGSANTITSTGAQAVNITGVTVAAAGVNFSSVSSSGGTNNVALTAGGTGTIALGGGALSGATAGAVVIGGGTTPITYSGTVAKTSTGQLISVGGTTGAVTFSGNLICTGCGAAGGAIGVASVTSAVTFSGGSKFITPAANFPGVVLSNSSDAPVNFLNGGLRITTSGTGTAFQIGSGTLQVTTGAITNTLSSADMVFQLAGTRVGASGITFASTTSTGGASGNVRMDNVYGGAIALGTGSLSGSTGEAAFFVRGDGVSTSPPVTYAGDISKTTMGGLIAITTYSGAMELSGNLSYSVADVGINVSGRGGGTITFSGATKTLHEHGIRRVPEHLQSQLCPDQRQVHEWWSRRDDHNRTRHCGGLGVRSFDHRRSQPEHAGVHHGNGPVHQWSGHSHRRPDLPQHLGQWWQQWHLLQPQTDGTQGFLSVTGDGGSASNGSGGTITNMVGADGQVPGNGVYLLDATAVSLKYMNFSNLPNNGVFGNRVAGFTIDKSRFTGTIGTFGGSPHEESVVQLLNSSGPMRITNSRLDGAAFAAISINNTATAQTIDSLVIAGDTVTNLQGTAASTSNTAIRFTMLHGAVPIARIDSNYITSWWDMGIRASIRANASGTLRIRNNYLGNANATGNAAGGISLTGGSLAYLIKGNTVMGAKAIAISADRVAEGTTMQGTIDGNTIGASGTANSGTATGIAIQATHHGTGATITKISSNVLRQIQGSANGAIQVISGDAAAYSGSGTLHATVVANDIAEVGTVPNAAQAGISILHGMTLGDTDVGCYDIGSSVTPALKNSVTSLNTNQIRMSQGAAATSRWPGYTGPSSIAGMSSYLLGRNTATSSANVITAPSVVANTSVPSVGAACTQPAVVP